MEGILTDGTVVTGAYHAARTGQVTLLPPRLFPARADPRARRGLSQEALGAEVGLHRTEVSLLERAQRDPRLETIVKLARGLGIRPADLLAGME